MRKKNMKFVQLLAFQQALLVDDSEEDGAQLLVLSCRVEDERGSGKLQELSIMVVVVVGEVEKKGRGERGGGWWRRERGRREGLGF